MRCRPLLSLLLAAALLLSIATSADAELVERGGLFVRFQGGLAPTALPRDSLAPISVSVAHNSGSPNAAKTDCPSLVIIEAG